MHDPLREAIGRSHRSLSKQFAESAEAVRGEATCGEVVQATDAFLIHTCRHVSAICDVILPAARKQLPVGRQRVKEYVHQVRRLERSVAQAKRRLYGESHAIHMPWAQVWTRLGDEFGNLMALEQMLVADLASEVGPRIGSDLASRLANAETTSPTRPHPHSPHTGRLAHPSRWMWMRADAVWDTVEGRIVSGAAKLVKRPRIAS